MTHFVYSIVFLVSTFLLDGLPHIILYLNSLTHVDIVKECLPYTDIVTGISPLDRCCLDCLI